MFTSNKAGKVYLVGAGPGDPELLTLKAVRALREAEVILVDDLVNPAALAHARPDCRVVKVGKRGGCKSTPQEFIQHLMIRLARRGKIVVRLKGGDPFVFGRGGEELLALRTAGIEVEIVSGITAGIGVPAALGIPVTHRDVARGVCFVTGHTYDGAIRDWAALANSGTTLVIYMGLANLGNIVEGLLDAGLAATTPACAIANGTLESEKHVIATLGTLGAAIAKNGITSPALMVIGEVVNLAALSLPAPKSAKFLRRVA